MYKKIKIEEIKDRSIDKTEGDEKDPIFSNFSNSPENYFQNILKEEEFEGLKKLVEDSNGIISWEKLIKKWVVKIEWREIEWIYWKRGLDLRWTSVESLWKIKKIKYYFYYMWSEEKLEDLWELEEVWESVNIEWTSVVDLWRLTEIKGSLYIKGSKVKTLGNMKNIWWELDCEGVVTLEDMWKLEEVRRWVDLRWTSVKSLWKLKKVWWYLDCNNVKTLIDLWELEELWLDLNLRWTSVKSLWKLKKIWWSLYCQNLKTLESLGTLEKVKERVELGWTSMKSLWKLRKVWWTLNCKDIKTLKDLWNLELVKGWVLDVSWTKIRSLWKLEEIPRWALYCKNIETLEDIWNLKKIWSNLYLKWSNIKIQLEVIREYKKNRFQMAWMIYFWWNLETIEILLNQERIPWILDLININIEKQVEFLYKREIWELKVMNIVIDRKIKKMRSKIYNKWEINYDKYEKIFGGNIKKIEDEEVKIIWEEILRMEYKKIKEQIKEKIKKIVEKNKGKNLEKEKKKEIKDKIKEWDIELAEVREKIESFGIKL